MPGLYASWKTWKVMEFYHLIFQAWKGMEFEYGSWKSGKMTDNDVFENKARNTSND